MLDYSQSGERIRGRRKIHQSRFLQPSTKRFAVRRILGGGDLRITEFVLTYDDARSYSVSIMEFRNGRIACARLNISETNSLRRPRLPILLSLSTDRLY